MKKFISIVTCLVLLLVLSGCDFTGSIFAPETIRTSVYPIEFITDYLYGEDAKVLSIYPDGADYKTYDLKPVLLLRDLIRSDLKVFESIK